MGESSKPVSLATMYGDGFTNLDHINDFNQYFASSATDPNYNLDELCHLRRAAEDKNVHSGAITCEYEVPCYLLYRKPLPA